jgi:hypothetical protein
VTGSPARCASSTSVRSSSGVNWQVMTSVPAVISPPLVITLTTSTPWATRSRTARRNPSRPLHSPPMPAQCPSRLVIGGPEATTVRPVRCPRCRSATAHRASPRSRTVVTPAASWAASDVRMMASRSASLCSGNRSSAVGPASPHRWTCASTSPGSRVTSPRSSTGQFAGAAAHPGSTPTISAPSTRTSAPSGSARSPSKARRARYPCMPGPRVGPRWRARYRGAGRCGAGTATLRGPAPSGRGVGEGWSFLSRAR